MPNITITSKVMDKYLKGRKINDAIRDEFHGEIQDRISQNPAFENMTPMQMVMMDAGIDRYSKVGDILNAGTYTSGGINTNEWLFPVWLETTLRESMYEQNVISYVVDTTIGVDGNTVQSPTLNLMSDKNKNAIKRARIAEGADIPVGTISIGERAVTLWKHGRAIEMTYEAVRRMQIPLFTRQMQAISSDLAHQNLDIAVDVLANGDGNDGSAATKVGTTATAGTITSTELIGFLLDYWFANHIPADTITSSVGILKVIGGMYFDTTLGAGASANVKFNMPQMNAQNVTVLAANVPKINGKDIILLSNRSNSLVRYEENGSNIQENQNFARNQTSLLTFTENSGYAINMAGSNMYIEIKSGS